MSSDVNELSRLLTYFLHVAWNIIKNMFIPISNKTYDFTIIIFQSEQLLCTKHIKKQQLIISYNFISIMLCINRMTNGHNILFSNDKCTPRIDI